MVVEPFHQIAINIDDVLCADALDLVCARVKEAVAGASGWPFSTKDYPVKSKVEFESFHACLCRAAHF
jgi:hypothetical protein